jgi:DNA helicase-2/ATP-dependent DNA helicase PcrA
MVGVEDGLFPQSRSKDDPEQMEEERRLAYVALPALKTGFTLPTPSNEPFTGEKK